MIQSKKDILRLEDEIKEMKRKSSYLTEANFNELIEENWVQLKRIVADENLKTMPIDTISTLEKGMPINRLVNHGFKTIYDIRDQSMENLMMIEALVKLVRMRFTKLF